MTTLSVQEKLAIAGLMTMGKSFVVDAYLMTHPKAQAKEYKDKTIYSQSSRWFNTPQAKKFRSEIAGNLGIHSTDSIESETMSDEQIIAELTRAAMNEADQSRKSQILVRLADMKSRVGQGKPDEMKVKIYLPFDSDCRQCKLYADAVSQRDKTE